MSRKAWIYFAAMSVIWGIPYLLIRVAVEGESGVSAPFLVFARCVIGAGLLLPFVLRGGQLAGLRRYWLPIAGFAIGEIMVPWVLLSHAEVKLTSSLTGV